MNFNMKQTRQQSTKLIYKSTSTTNADTNEHQSRNAKIQWNGEWCTAKRDESTAPQALLPKKKENMSYQGKKNFDIYSFWKEILRQ